MKKGRWILLVVSVVALGYWIYIETSKPLPGQETPDDGREHVTDIDGIKYSSDPPTSGPHFAVWAKSGVYDRLISDGYLIHSLEHGYVVIWYDCTEPMLNATGKADEVWPMLNVYAHEEPVKNSTDSGQPLKHMKVSPQGNMSWFTPQNPPAEEVALPESFKTDSCKNLVDKLSEYTKLAQRVIVLPRLGLKTPIVLTAWRRIEELTFPDDAKIKKFIKAFHNKGPEATKE